MATLHLGAQSLECAKLQLLDGSRRFLQQRGDFADAALFDEAFVDDAALNGGKFVDEVKQVGALLDRLHVEDSAAFSPRRVGFGFGRIVDFDRIEVFTFKAIDEGVDGDAEEPRGKGSSAPFVTWEISEGLVEDFGGDVFGDSPIADAAGDEGVEACEVKFVEGAEFCGVALRGFNEQALVRALRRGFLCRTLDGYHVSAYSNCREGRKVTEGFAAREPACSHPATPKLRYQARAV